MIDDICTRCAHYKELLASSPKKPEICKDCTKYKNKKGFKKHRNWKCALNV